MPLFAGLGKIITEFIFFKHVWIKKTLKGFLVGWPESSFGVFQMKTPNELFGQATNYQAYKLISSHLHN